MIKKHLGQQTQKGLNNMKFQNHPKKQRNIQNFEDIVTLHFFLNFENRHETFAMNRKYMHNIDLNNLKSIKMFCVLCILLFSIGHWLCLSRIDKFDGNWTLAVPIVSIFVISRKFHVD